MKLRFYALKAVRPGNPAISLFYNGSFHNPTTPCVTDDITRAALWRSEEAAKTKTKTLPRLNLYPWEIFPVVFDEPEEGEEEDGHAL